MTTGINGKQIKDGTIEKIDLHVELQRKVRDGWFDLLAPISASGVPSSNAPTWQSFGPAAPRQRRELAFNIGDYVFVQAFHTNHDMKPNSKAYFHVHWATNGTSTLPVRWELGIQRALGHNQANFGAPTIYTIEQAAHGTAWRHMVTEMSDAQAITITEPDELILVTLCRVSNGGTDNPDRVFALNGDFHYERDRDATPRKAPNFYAEA
jgi:hypothetical protein